MDKIIKIKHGVTFKGSVSTGGIFLSIFALIITTLPLTKENVPLFVSYIGIGLLIIGILLFLSIRGVWIDVENNKIKSYLFLFKRIGNWESLKDYYEVLLKYINIDSSIGIFGPSSNVRTISYDVVLISDTKHDFVLKEFVKYEKAKAFMISYAKLLNKPYNDRFDELKQKYQEYKKKLEP